MYPLLRVPKEQHLYKPGATFSKVMMLYRFDKKLRLLLFNEIEKIEVAVRSAIVKHGCEVTGDPFWMTNPNNFSNPVKFNKTIRLIEDELNRRTKQEQSQARLSYALRGGGSRRQHTLKGRIHHPFPGNLLWPFSSSMDVVRDTAVGSSDKYILQHQE